MNFKKVFLGEEVIEICSKFWGDSKNRNEIFSGLEFGSPLFKIGTSLCAFFGFSISGILSKMV